MADNTAAGAGAATTPGVTPSMGDAAREQAAQQASQQQAAAPAPAGGQAPVITLPGANPPAPSSTTPAPAPEGVEGAGQAGQQQQAAEGAAPEGQEQKPFYDDVDALWGEPIVQVEYGDVDPETPQGAYLREQAIYAKAQADLEEGMMRGNPRAYQYFLHTQNGGSDEAFFGSATPTLPDRELLTTDISLQKRFVKQDLVARRLSESHADSLVAAMEADKSLGREALAVYDQKVKAQEQAIRDEAEKLERSQKVVQQSLDDLNRNLTGLVNKDLQFIIPQADQPGFYGFFSSLLNLDENKQLRLAIPLDQAKLRQIAQAVYLVWKEGDLTGPINKAAATQNVRRIREAVNSNNATRPGTGASTNPAPKGLAEAWPVK